MRSTLYKDHLYCRSCNKAYHVKVEGNFDPVLKRKLIGRCLRCQEYTRKHFRRMRKFTRKFNIRKNNEEKLKALRDRGVFHPTKLPDEFCLDLTPTDFNVRNIRLRNFHGGWIIDKATLRKWKQKRIGPQPDVDGNYSINDIWNFIMVSDVVGMDTKTRMLCEEARATYVKFDLALTELTLARVSEKCSKRRNLKHVVQNYSRPEGSNEQTLQRS